MKNTKILTVLIAGFLGASASYGDVTVTPFTPTLPVGFDKDITDMFNSENASLINNIVDGGLNVEHDSAPDSGSFIQWTGTEFNGYNTGAIADPINNIVFSYLDNKPSSVILDAGGKFKIGYIGKEAGDKNVFGWSYTDRAGLDNLAIELPDIDLPNGGILVDTATDAPKTSFEVTNDSLSESEEIFLWAYDPKSSSPKSSFMGETHSGWDRLEVFEHEINAETGEYAYLILMDDRLNGEGESSDYDDMIMYMVTEGATIVPEPATVGLIAFGGLLGLMVYRRRR